MANQTPNLLLDHWISAQAQPEVPVDTTFDGLDRALCGMFTHDMLSDADYILSDITDPKEWMHLVIEITDTTVALTTTRNIIVPDNNKAYFFLNSTVRSLVLTTAGGTGITVLAAGKEVLYCDGTNVVTYASGGAAGVTDFTDLGDVPGSYASGDAKKVVKVNAGETALEFVAEPIDFGLTVGGTPTNTQECLRLPMVRTLDFPSAMAGSQAKAKTASTGNVAFSLQKNGTEFGTITFNVTGTGVFAAATATSFAIGDQLTILAPASADASLADIGIILTGTRT